MDNLVHTINSTAIKAIEEGNITAATESYRRLVEMSKPACVAIGDSHVFSFSAPKLLNIWLGPVTAYRLGRDRGKPITLRDMAIEPPIKIIFVFGEIDARQHIHRVAEEQNACYDFVSEKIVEYYLDAIQQITVGFAKSDIHVATVVPPHEIPQNSIHAFVNAPPLSVRATTARILNQKLQTGVAIHGFSLLDVYDLFADEAGLLPDEFTEDDIHIYSAGGRARLSEYLCKKIDVLKIDE